MASLPLRQREMSRPVYSVAIVGSGRIAGLFDSPREQGPISSHAQACHRHPAFRLDAVCDTDVDRLKVFQRTWGVSRAYTSLADLLKHEQPTVVILSSSTDQHFPQLCQLLEAARRIPVVFVEKPLCQRQAEWQDLKALVDRANDVTVLVNHTRRFDPSHQRLADLIKGGQLGPLVSGRCDYYGGWLNNGSHLVDTLRMFIGDLAIRKAQLGPQGRPGDPCLDVRLAASGAFIDLIGFDERCYQIFEMDLRFERGRIQVRNFGEEMIVERAEVNGFGDRMLVALAEAPQCGMDSPLFHAVEAIARHLRGDKLLETSGATLSQGAETMALIWKAADHI